MLEGSRVYVRSTKACLQDVPQLHEYMSTFGEIESEWLPNERKFGFLTFRESKAAAEAVKKSPHMIGESEVICEFQKSQIPEKVGQQNTQKHGLAGEVDGGLAVSDILKQMVDQGQHFPHYLPPAPVQQLKVFLDDDMGARLRLSNAKLCGSAQQLPSKIPLALLYGPPGTGKTHAVEWLAAQPKVQAFKLNARQLVALRAETLFEQLLQTISRMEKTLIFVDECEVIFPHRNAMSTYASLEVRSHQRMLANFLEWTSQAPGDRPPLIILATNCLDQLDPAVIDRVRMIPFDLPGPADCAKLWLGHSPCWAQKDVKCKLLGLLSSSMGLSFRCMDDIFKKVRDFDAAPGQSMPDQRPGEPKLEIYFKHIFQHARIQFPLYQNLMLVSRWIRFVADCLYVYDRGQNLRVRFQRVPAARL